MSRETSRIHPVTSWFAYLSMYGIILVFCYWSPTFSEPKMMVMAVSAIVLLAVSLRSGVQWCGPFRVLLPWFVLLGYGLAVSVFVVDGPRRIETLVTVFQGGLILLVALSMCRFMEEKKGREKLYAGLIGAGVLVGFFAMGQEQGWLAPLFPVFDHYDQSMYSVFGNEDLLGGYMAMVLPLFLFELLYPIKRFNIIWVLLIGLCLYLLIACSSRSAWLAASCSVAYSIYFVVLKREEKKIHWGWLLFPLIVLVPMGTRVFTRISETFGAGDVGGNLRILFYDATLRMIGDHPFFGVGMGQYAYHSPAYTGAALWAPGGMQHVYNHVDTIHAHSDVLELAAETGVVGLLILLWALWRIPRKATLFMGCLIGFAVFSLLNPVAHSPAHAYTAVVCLLLHCYVGRGKEESYRRVANKDRRLKEKQERLAHWNE